MRYLGTHPKRSLSESQLRAQLAREYYIRVDSGEGVRKVNGNREEVYA